MMCKREATLVVQEDFLKEATSVLSSECLEGAIGPQGLKTPGRGDENNNPALVLFCRKKMKSIFTKKR